MEGAPVRKDPAPSDGADWPYSSASPNLTMELNIPLFLADCGKHNSNLLLNE